MSADDSDNIDLQKVDARIVSTVRSLQKRKPSTKSLDMNNHEGPYTAGKHLTKEDDDNFENSFEKLTSSLAAKNKENPLIKTVDDYVLNQFKGGIKPPAKHITSDGKVVNSITNNKIFLDSNGSNNLKAQTNKNVAKVENGTIEQPSKNLFKSSKELAGITANRHQFLKSMTMKSNSKYGNMFRETRLKAKPNKLLMDEKYVDKLKVYALNQIENDNDLKNKAVLCGIADLKKFIQEKLFDDKIFMYKLDLLMTDTTFNKQKKEKYFKTEIKTEMEEILLEKKQLAIFNKLDDNINQHLQFIANFDFISI